MLVRQGTGNNASHNRMRERKLQRRGLQWNAVALAHRLNPRDLVQHLGRRRRIAVLGSLDRTGGQNSGGIRRSHDNPNASVRAGRELAMQNILVDQRVWHRDEEEIDRPSIEETPYHRFFVDADANRRDLRGTLQFIERLPARLELAEPGRDIQLGLVVSEVEVVDHKGLYPVQAEPHQAVLVGAHDAVVRIVEPRNEREATRPRRCYALRRTACEAGVHTTDLRRTDERGRVLLTQQMSDAMFAETVSVPGRRVEVTDTAAPCRLKHFLRILFLDTLEQFSKGRSAKTQCR